MPLQQLFTSRKPYDAETFVGQEGKIFYDEEAGLFRLGDGTTPGGKIVGNLAIAATGTTAPINPYPGELWYDPSTKELWAYYDGAFRGTINLATSSTLGGVRLGPGVVLNGQDQIIIDSTGLDFNFGNFNALTLTYPVGHPKEGEEFAVLQTINTNEDAVLASNGTGAVKVVGEFAIFPANGSVEGSMLELPVLTVSADGDITATTLDIINTGTLGLQAPLNVTINEQGLTKTPAVISGSVAQFTGRDNRAPIIVLDSYGIDATRNITGGELVFRTGRGSNSTTTSVLSGDRLGEVTAAGWASNGYGGLGVGGMRILAAENFTSTARGSKLEFYVVLPGTLTTSTIATVDSSGITLTSGKVFTGNVTGNVSGTAGSVAAANITGTTLASNVVSSSLTSVGTLTSLAIATGGTITTPRVVINDGGIRTINGGTTCTIDFSTDSIILWTAPSGTAAITLTNYTAGATVKLIIAMTTSRDVTYGISSVANSSTGDDNWNGAGAGSTSIANTAMHLNYTCITSAASGCYVAVTVL